MNSNDLVINTENLSNSFGEVHALKSLDLRVPQKSIFAFLLITTGFFAKSQIKPKFTNHQF